MNKYNIDFFYHTESVCFKSVIILVKDKNTSLKLPVGCFPTSSRKGLGVIRAKIGPHLRCR